MLNSVLKVNEFSDLRVVVAHDYLTQRGGAERVVLSILRSFPQARVITSVYDPDRTFDEFRAHDVRTTWLQRIPLVRSDPRLALPLLPTAFSGYRVPDADVVICSSSGWAHGIRTEAPKIVYCHNPPRWLHQSSDYAASQALPVRLALEVMRNRLTGWDRAAATSATTYLANSSTVHERIMRTYGIEAQIVPPPIGIDVAGPQEPVPGVSPGFLLSVSRARGYKNTSLLATAVEAIPGAALFMVGGLPDHPEGRTWPSRMQGGRDLSDAQLRWLYAHCSGLAAVSHEDFGLTPLEANAFGKPVACLRAGGYLDTLRPGINGVFIDGLSVPLIRDGLERLRAKAFDAALIRQHAAQYSELAFGQRLRGVVEQTLAYRPPHKSSVPVQSVDVRDRDVCSGRGG